MHGHRSIYCSCDGDCDGAANTVKDGVKQKDGSYKYLNGLYIIDGSVFPTSLGVNPQLTIYGMSARNATALADKLKA